MEFSTPLNKFEKKEKVIHLHAKEGKTLKEIATELHMSFRDISKIIKAYDKKIRLQDKKQEDNPSSQTKKLSITSLVFRQFREGKKLTDVAIDLEIPAKKVEKLWSQYLELEGMADCYDFYKVYQHDIPRFLTIRNFIINNHVQIKNIVIVLKAAKNIAGLKVQQFMLKDEISELQKTKKNLQYLQNNQNHTRLPFPKFKMD